MSETVDSSRPTQASARAQEAAMDRPRPRKGPDRITVALFASTAFLLVLTFLAIQLSDAAGPPKAIVVRRIYETKVIETVSGGLGSGSTSVTQSSAAPYSSTYGVAATGSSR